MRDQGYHHADRVRSTDLQDPLPSQTDLTPPQERSQSPYFTSWVRQQVVDHFGPFTGLRRRPADHDDARPRPPEGGRERRSAQVLPPASGCRRASLVAIDNNTGEVRAMVGGTDYAHAPVQPRDAGPAPAGLDVQAVHARRRRSSRASPPARSGARAPKEFVVPAQRRERVLRRQELRQRVLRARTRSRARRRSPTTRSTPRSASSVGTRKIARVARRAWASARRSRRTTR